MSERSAETPDANFSIERKTHNTGLENVSFLEKGTGTPVIMLPGWLVTSEMYRNIMAGFDPKEFRTIALDLPGFRDSDLLRDKIAYASLCSWTQRFMDSQKIQVAHFVGVSFGAAIALNFAHQNPDRVGKVVVNAPPVFFGRYITERQKRLKKFIESSQVVKGFFFWAMQKGYRWPFRVLGGHDTTNSKETEFASFLIKETQVAQLRSVTETLQQVIDTDLRPILPSIKGPVLIITGGLDYMLKDSEEAQVLLPTSSLVVVEGEDHIMLQRRPHEFSQQVADFIRPKD